MPNSIDVNYRNKIIEYAEAFVFNKVRKEKLPFYNKHIDAENMTLFINVYIMISYRNSKTVSFEKVGRIVNYAANSSEIIKHVYAVFGLLNLDGDPSDMLFCKYIPKDDNSNVNSIW